MLFCVAGAALCDIPTCLITCRKLFWRNTFATFSQDELQLSWQAQHFGDFCRHFAGRRSTSDVSHCTPHSTFHTPRSTLYTSHSTRYIPRFTLYTPHETDEVVYRCCSSLMFDDVWGLLFCCWFTYFRAASAFSRMRSKGPRYTPQFTLQTLHFTLHTLHSALYTVHTLYTLHFTLYTSHSTLYTPHSALYTPHSTLCTLHSAL